MGQPVVISHRMGRRYMNNGKLVWTPDTHVRTGWLVGVRYIQDGIAERDSEYGTVWTASGVHLAAVFAEWPSAKHYYVPADAVRPYKHGIDPPPTGPAPWDALDRERLSSEMKKWPRTAKGHFLKATGPRNTCKYAPCNGCVLADVCPAPDPVILMRRRDARK